MKIRKYKSKDQERCRSLWTEMTQHHRNIYNDPTIGGDDPGLEFDKHLGLVGTDKVWVVEVDDEIVGFTALVLKDQEAEIEPIVVASSHRGKGFGRALLNHVIIEAKKSGILCLSVRPVARNEDAVSFFYDSGFKTLGHIQMFMWLGECSPDSWKPGPVLFGKSFKV